MRRAIAGQYVTTTVAGESARCFVPSPLPPSPPLALDDASAHAVERANIALGRLDGVSSAVPDTRLFLYAYVRKEAVLSSQIEGTQSSLSDLLLFEVDEAPGVPFDDVVEVSNYVAALELGLERLRENVPISNRLIRELHAILLSRGRGQGKLPGEFRRSQNWIGGTRPGDAHFVPPPHERIEELMAQLERFIHNQPARTPTLIKAALAHAQFETIHPFLDGNGRVGRLLIPMLLSAEDVLREPLLYLSLYLKKHRAQYYEMLNRVRTEGEWEEWVRFFADGVTEAAEGAVATAERLLGIAQADRTRVQGVGRISGSALQVHHALLSRPISTISRLAAATKLSVPAVTASLRALTDLGLVREITGRKRGRVFGYSSYLEVLNQGTDLP
ncbi:MAG: Fic family protein [Candidatus Eiseniibacteriota bacterium]